jgi:hemerythrin-like domain-containing protein
MPEVTGMLREDHQKVKDLFEEFENAEEDGEKLRIVRTALAELEIHATLEEEIFYPAVREQIEEDDEDTMDEALEEHHVAKFIMRELKDMKPGDERFDAKFKVLAESVKHHIEEEESEILPKADEMELDQEQLAEEMTERKQELQQQLKQTDGGSRTSARSSAGRRGPAKSKAAVKKTESTRQRKSA